MSGWLSDRRVAVPVGLLAVVVSLLLIFPAPIVLPGVLAWWLHLDLVDDDGPGWLGIAALTLFGLVGAGVAVVIISLDTHFQCGGTLGGFGESASARLDEACVAVRGWRSIVGAVAVLASTIVAGVRLRRAETAQAKWGVPRAVTTSTGLIVILVVVVITLVLT